jgi:F-type H+-transporting ATPase subunit b
VEATLDLLGISGKMLLLQIIPFLLAVAGLHFIIFKPMLANLKEREENIHGFKKAAEGMHDQVEDKVAELEEKLASARAEAAAERSRLRTEAAAAESSILEAARAQADEIVKHAREELARDREAAQAQLAASADELSRSIAARVLGRKLEG